MEMSYRDVVSPEQALREHVTPHVWLFVANIPSRNPKLDEAVIPSAINKVYRPVRHPQLGD